MLTFKQALEQGFKFVPDVPPGTVYLVPDSTAEDGYWSFKFGDGYELCFESLLFDNQYYVALYKDKNLLTEKVVVKPGYTKGGDENRENN